MEDDKKSVTDLPYFEGDFWPKSIEKCLQNFKQKEEERKKAEAIQTAQKKAENNQESQSDDMVWVYCC